MLLIGVLIFGAKGYVENNFMDGTEGSLDLSDYKQAFSNLFKQLGRSTGPQIPLNNKLYPIFVNDDESGFLIESESGDKEVFYEKASGTYYLILDEDRDPAQGDKEKRVYSKEYTHLQSLWHQSLVKAFYLHYFGLALILLGLLKDLIGSISERKSNASTADDREKRGIKIYTALAKAVAKENIKSVSTLLEKDKAADYIPRKLANAELILGQALILTGKDDKALPLLRRYIGKNRKDIEASKVLAQYFVANPKDARIQDFPTIVNALEELELNDDLRGLISSMVIKYKITDRKSLHSVSKICSESTEDLELREHLLSTFVEMKDFDEEVQDFYEFCRACNLDDPRPLVMLAESTLAKGQFQLALTYLEPLLSMDYQNQRVHEMLLSIYEVLERLDDLYKVYESILNQYPEEPIALAQQRFIRSKPDFELDESDLGSSLSVEELIAKTKDNKSEAEDILLKKYERILSIMFTDIEGYTRMTESQSIVETMAILQESDQIIVPIIKKHEGVVIKKIGDAFMARFDSPDSALMAGIQIQQAIFKNNQERQAAEKIAWNIRLGINTGPVFVKDGDIFGDAVNIASRVESNARVGEVYCTRETVQAIGSQRFQFESRDSRKVKGKSEPIELLAVLFDPAAES